MARILIVDDSLAIRMILRTILESAGHEVVAEAADGRRALIEYCKHKPDLVTLCVRIVVVQEPEIYI